MNARSTKNTRPACTSPRYRAHWLRRRAGAYSFSTRYLASRAAMVALSVSSLSSLLALYAMLTWLNGFSGAFWNCLWMISRIWFWRRPGCWGQRASTTPRRGGGGAAGKGRGEGGGGRGRGSLSLFLGRAWLSCRRALRLPLIVVLSKSAQLSSASTSAHHSPDPATRDQRSPTLDPTLDPTLAPLAVLTSSLSLGISRSRYAAKAALYRFSGCLSISPAWCQLIDHNAVDEQCASERTRASSFPPYMSLLYSRS